jgi:hypothetical protein
MRTSEISNADRIWASTPQNLAYQEGRRLCFPHSVAAVFCDVQFLGGQLSITKQAYIQQVLYGACFD